MPPRRLRPARRRRRPPDVVLVGTGSEVQLAVEARELLAADGRPRPRGLDAVPRVVRRPGRVLPRDRHPADGQGPGLRRGRHRPGLARDRRRPRPDRLDRALRRLAPTTPASTSEFGITAEAVAAAAEDSIRAVTG